MKKAWKYFFIALTVELLFLVVIPFVGISLPSLKEHSDRYYGFCNEYMFSDVETMDDSTYPCSYSEYMQKEISFDLFFLILWLASTFPVCFIGAVAAFVIGYFQPNIGTKLVRCLKDDFSWRSDPPPSA